MTATATALRRGPFNGPFLPHGVLYSLSEPLEHEGRTYDHVIVSAIEEDDWGPAETLVLPADSGAHVHFVMDEFPYLKEGTTDHVEALEKLGYEAELLLPVVEN